MGSQPAAPSPIPAVCPEQEARALSSLLNRASDRLATYEEETHRDRRLAEEMREAAGDLVNRISHAGSMA
jgi:hypothetical protein